MTYGDIAVFRYRSAGRLKVRMSRWLPAAAIIAALAVAGCGGDGSPESRARNVAESYLRAMGDGDFDEVCDLMTTESRIEAGQYGRQLNVRATCASVLDAVSEDTLTDKQRENLSRAEGQRLDLVKRNDGRFQVQAGGIVLGAAVKEDGEWKMKPANTVEYADAPASTEMEPTATVDKPSRSDEYARYEQCIENAPTFNTGHCRKFLP